MKGKNICLGRRTEVHLLGEDWRLTVSTGVVVQYCGATEIEKYYGVVETYYFGSIAVKKLQYGNKTER